mmetsp:Transcript_62423/g.110065  ORF Transcript_62423/g.110065 Transcript_62423/m.110065 type:complete len:281 (+) Transcript_62423:250-1092(+)
MAYSVSAGQQLILARAQLLLLQRSDRLLSLHLLAQSATTHLAEAEALRWWVGELRVTGALARSSRVSAEGLNLTRRQTDCDCSRSGAERRGVGRSAESGSRAHSCARLQRGHSGHHCIERRAGGDGGSGAVLAHSTSLTAGGRAGLAGVAEVPGAVAGVAHAGAEAAAGEGSERILATESHPGGRGGVGAMGLHHIAGALVQQSRDRHRAAHGAPAVGSLAAVGGSSTHCSPSGTINGGSHHVAEITSRDHVQEVMGAAGAGHGCAGGRARLFRRSQHPL